MSDMTYRLSYLLIFHCPACRAAQPPTHQWQSSHPHSLRINIQQRNSTKKHQFK